MKRQLWDQEEIDFLIQYYADDFTEDIATALERPITSVYNKAHALGLKKSKEFVQATGKMSSSHPNAIASRYQKGRIPENKGKEMPPEVYQKCKPTMFKKGDLPHNTHREGDGAISKRNDYWYIRVSLAKWRQLHTYTWEQANRPIDPKTEMIKFRDGNRDNCALENLYLCTRADNMRDNTIHRYDPEIKDAIRTIHKLKRTIIKHEKQDH